MEGDVEVQKEIISSDEELEEVTNPNLFDTPQLKTILNKYSLTSIYYHPQN